jgi:ribonuclease HI
MIMSDKNINFLNLKMKILNEVKSNYFIEISSEIEICLISFDRELKTLTFESENQLCNTLKNNKYQLSKLLRNKNKNSFYIGFELAFSLIDGKDIEAFNNKDNIIAIKNNNTFIIKNDEHSSYIKIYTDGSYDEIKKVGAYCVIKINEDLSYDSNTYLSNNHSSSQIELEAVIKALEFYNGNVRIYTDSQYIRKGISEWIYYWKKNDWLTANGSKAKNIDMWIKLEKLCSGRIVEFAYVKGHSNNVYNNICDKLAKERAKGV